MNEFHTKHEVLSFWIVIPAALFLGIFLGAIILQWRKRIGFAVVFLLLALAVSLSWMLSLRADHGAVLAWNNRRSRTVGAADIYSEQGGVCIEVETINNGSDFDEHSPIICINYREFSKERPARYPIRTGDRKENLNITPWTWLEDPLGFQFLWGTGPFPLGGDFHRYAITMPHWFLLLLCIPIPALHLLRSLRRRNRLRNGSCAECGYDLHSSLERCPECGNPVKKVQQPKMAIDNRVSD